MVVFNLCTESIDKLLQSKNDERDDVENRRLVSFYTSQLYTYILEVRKKKKNISDKSSDMI